jgi:putative oxidoreductase
MKPLFKFHETVCRIARSIRWFPPLFARLVVGAVFLEAGIEKLSHLDKVVSFFGQLGIPGPYVMAPFVAVVEFLGGALLLAGCFTRVASVPLAITMIVALLTAKRADVHGVVELFGMSEFLYLTLFAYLFVEGGGKASVDMLLRKKFGGGGSPHAEGKVAKAA